MIELLILQHLSALLDVPTVAEVPKTGKTYVLVERTGGGEENHITRATVAVQSIAETLYKAAELNERVKVAMKQLAEHPQVGRVQLNTDYNFTDTTKKEYRYQAVYDLTYYGEV